MVPLSMTLSDLWPTFQGHDNIECPITRLTVSRVWSVQWFRFQWAWVTLNVDFKITEMPFDELCAQLTRDLFSISKFLSKPQYWNLAWGSGPGTASPTPNFVKKIAPGDIPLWGKFIPKVRNFCVFELHQPTFHTYYVDWYLNEPGKH